MFLFFVYSLIFLLIYLLSTYYSFYTLGVRAYWTIRLALVTAIIVIRQENLDICIYMLLCLSLDDRLIYFFFFLLKC